MTILRILVLSAALALFADQAATRAVAQNSPSGLTLRPNAATASPGSADAAQAAKDLVAVVTETMMSDLATKMTAQVWPTMESTLRTQNPNLDASTVAELRSEFERLVTESMSEVMQSAPAIYQRYFTADELNGLLAFYRTPLGAKTLKMMPQVMSDVSAVILPRMQGLQQRVNLAFLTILQKRGLYAQ